jgi:hypothetical protein
LLKQFVKEKIKTPPLGPDEGGQILKSTLGQNLDKQMVRSPNITNKDKYRDVVSGTIRRRRRLVSKERTERSSSSSSSSSNQHKDVKVPRYLHMVDLPDDLRDALRVSNFCLFSLYYI